MRRAFGRTFSAVRCAVVLLFGGLVFSIAVAWGSAAFLSVARFGRFRDVELSSIDLVDGYAIFANDLRGFTMCRRGWETDYIFGYPTGWPSFFELGMARSTRSADDARWYHPVNTRWGLVNRPLGKEALACPIEDARGWPALCMLATFKHGIAGGEFVCDQGLPIGIKAGKDFEIRALPIIPIWGGLAFNIVFYAVAFWGISAVVRKRRQHFRQRAGNCAACGYCLEGVSAARCPECGSDRMNRGGVQSAPTKPCKAD